LSLLPSGCRTTEKIRSIRGKSITEAKRAWHGRQVRNGLTNQEEQNLGSHEGVRVQPLGVRVA